MNAIHAMKSLVEKAKKKEEEKNRKSTNTTASQPASVAGAAKKTAQQTAKKVAYYSKKGVAKNAQKVLTKTKYYSQAKPTAGKVYSQKPLIQFVDSSPLEGIPYGRSFATDYAKTQRLTNMENYTPGFRVKEENPVKALSAQKYYRKKETAKNLAKNVVKKTISKAAFAKRRHANWEEKAPFRDWVNTLGYSSGEEDKGSTLAQVARRAALYGAVFPTTQGYTPEQAKALQAQIRNAPVDLQDLFIKSAGDLLPIRDISGENGVFLPEYGQVFGDLQKIATGGFGTHWHEYGHNLDWLSNRYGEQPMYSSTYAKDGKTLDDFIAEDWDKTLRDYWTTYKGNTGPYDEKAARESLGDDVYWAYPGSYVPVADIFSAYSAERGGDAFGMGYGHDASYWRNGPSNSEAEAFAELSSAAVQGGDTLRLVQAFLPNTYDAYLDMLARMKKSPYSSYQYHLPQK